MWDRFFYNIDQEGDEKMEKKQILYVAGDLKTELEESEKMESDREGVKPESSQTSTWGDFLTIICC